MSKCRTIAKNNNKLLGMTALRYSITNRNTKSINKI